MKDDELAKKGIWIERQVISSEICALLASYALLKEDIKPNRYRRGDPLKNVHREYADPLMESLFHRIQPIVEQATGLSLWPTLSFYYTYRKHQALLPHQDRASCELVAGLYIGADDVTQCDGWPLWFDLGGESVSFDLSPGDLLIFKGNQIKHWRDPFPGDWFISAIFGFVDRHGPYAFLKYDQRRALGRPHVGMFRWIYRYFWYRFVRN